MRWWGAGEHQHRKGKGKPEKAKENGNKVQFLVNCVGACILSKAFPISVCSLWPELCERKKPPEMGQEVAGRGKWEIIHTEVSTSMVTRRFLILEALQLEFLGILWNPCLDPQGLPWEFWVSVNSSGNSSAFSKPFFPQTLLMLPSLVLDWSPEHPQIIWFVLSPLTGIFLFQTGINLYLLRFHMKSKFLQHSSEQRAWFTILRWPCFH